MGALCLRRTRPRPGRPGDVEGRMRRDLPFDEGLDHVQQDREHALAVEGRDGVALRQDTFVLELPPPTREGAADQDGRLRSAKLQHDVDHVVAGTI